MSGSYQPGWLTRLQPASWRGVPFAVLGGTIRRGRRTALHEYPYRDDVWVEDIGRNTRLIQMFGFLVGDDWIEQQDAMLAAAEAQGPGELIHPMLGSRMVSLAEPMSATTRHDAGRVVELFFEFIEGAQPEYPDATTDTGASVFDAAGVSVTAADYDFTAAMPVGSAGAGGIGAAVGDLRGGVRNVLDQTGIPEATRVAQSFTSQTRALANDATGAFNAVRGLPGAFGRYASGGRSTALPGIVTVSDALNAAARARSQVENAAGSVDRLVNLL